MQESWQMEREEERRVAAARQAVIDGAQKELNGFNKQRKAALANAIDQERKEDAERLAAVLAKEMAEDERDSRIFLMIRPNALIAGMGIQDAYALPRGRSGDDHDEGPTGPFL